MLASVQSISAVAHLRSMTCTPLLPSVGFFNKTALFIQVRCSASSVYAVHARVHSPPLRRTDVPPAFQPEKPV